jgi:hypothetical protein
MIGPFEEQSRAPWRTVFSTLAREFPRLSYIHFRRIDIEIPRLYVAFDTDPENDDERAWDDDQSDEDFWKTQSSSEPISPSFLLQARGVTDVRHRLRVITKNHRFAVPEPHELEQDVRKPLWPASDDKT